MNKLIMLAALMALAMAATPISIVVHEDPYYTDVCLETSGELC